MTTVQLTLNLPDSLASAAGAAGLLTPDAIESMLREQLRKQAGEKLRAMWERSPREEITLEIEQEIAEDVRAVRSEQRKRSGS